ncbi:hypothetical protein [Streptomyces sp. NPDC054794]
MAAGSFSLLTVPSPVAIGSAALIVWFLFPYRQIRRAALVLSQSPAERTGALKRSVKSGAARRALPTLRKAARERIVDGLPSARVAQQQLRALEQASYDVRRPRDADDGVSTRELAFGAYIGPNPWQRAVRTGLSAAVIGAPWTLLSLASAAITTGTHAHYPVLAIAAMAMPIMLTWVGFGLLYGYFFPLLRGETGLAKALWMYGVMVIPAALQVLSSHDPSHWTAWTHTILYALQALTFVMTLGLRADADVLTTIRMRPARLTDIHNLGSITAWWSSTAAALAAGVATVIIAGAQPFVLDIFPHSPQAPTTTAPPSNAPTPSSSAGGGSTTPPPADRLQRHARA